MRRLRSAVLVGLFVFGATPASRAADTPYGVFLDGRPMDRNGSSALVRGGVAYANLVRFVKAFDGLLTFEQSGAIRVSLHDHTMVFTPARRMAELDGAPVRLPAAPLVVDGDLFAPLTTLAKLAGASLHLDSRTHRALLTLDGGDGFAPTATGADDGLTAPSPTPSPLPVPSAVASAAPPSPQQTPASPLPPASPSPAASP